MVRTHRAFRWWFPVTVLILTLGIGSAFSSSLVQAQDGGTGQQATVDFELEVDPESSFDPFCLGSTRSVRATVRQLVSVSGGSDAGRVRVQTPTIQYSYPESILEDVTTTGALSWGNVLSEQTFSFTGRETGSGSIDIIAVIPTSTQLTLDDEVGLPIPRTVTRRASVQVHVIPCEYEVSASIVWSTRVASADAVLIGSIRRFRVRLDDGSFEAQPVYQLHTTANRFRGCRGVSTNSSSHPETLRGEVTSNDRVRLTLELFPQDETTLFSCDRSSDQRPRGCGDLPDGRCYPEIQAGNTWRWAPLTVEFPLDGGSSTVPLPLTHPGGTAPGSATITITPVERQ